jgi:hypothetical protein
MTPKDEVTLNRPPVRRSLRSAIAEHPVLFGLTAMLGAAVAAAGIVLGGGDSDEAPIRVKNGSLDLYILSKNQAWENSGGSGNWQIKNARRFGDFDVTVAVRAGASCGPSHTATGADVVVTYSDGKEIRLESAGQKTMVKPGAGVTMTLVSDQQLGYQPTGAGFIKQLAVGTGGNPAVLCTFTTKEQLDHILILNVP